MEAPQYKYPLFTTPDVHCGGEVADFINKHAGGAILFEFDDQPVGGPELGPGEVKDAVWSFAAHSQVFIVMLTEEFSSTPVIQQDNYAIVGRHASGRDSDGLPDVPFFAYYSIVAIYNHQLAKLLPDQFPIQLREVGPFTFAKFAASGSLPFLAPDDLKHMRIRDKSTSLKLFFIAVDKVLLAVSQEYPDDMRLVDNIAKLDTTQQVATEQSKQSPPEQKIELNAAELKAGTLGLSATAEPPKPTGPIGAKVAAATSEYGTPPDALGYEAYANALGDLIRHRDTGTPLTIAICAKWGMGKTTLMNYIKRRMDEVGTTSGETYDKTDFNAWKYSKSDAIWAAFYSVILDSIEKALGPFERVLFRSYVGRKTHPAWYTGWWIGAVVFVLLLGALGYFLFMAPEAAPAGAPEYQLKEIITVVENKPTVDSTATLVIKQPKPEPAPFISFRSLNLEKLLAVATGLVTLVSTLWGPFRSLSRGILGKVKKGGADLGPQTQSDVIKYVDSIKEWLERKFERERTRRLNRLPKRFVVFVDDIDRVEPNQVMQMMEAIKLFLETPRFVFVLAMDARVVRRAIGEHYRFMAETADDREKLGHDYLEKIIQIPFYLPKIARRYLDRLQSQLLGGQEMPEQPALAPAVPEEAPATAAPGAGAKERILKGRSAIVDQPAGEKGDEKTQTPDTTSTKPAPDDKLEMELSNSEKRALSDLFNDGMKMSPRQIVRYRNVYLLARHLHLRRFSDKPLPPTEFTKWIALSVRYPFEIRELVRICFDANWKIGWQAVFNRLAEESSGNDRWAEMRRGDLPELARLLNDHVPEAPAVKEFIVVSNCFNLVLD